MSDTQRQQYAKQLRDYSDSHCNRYGDCPLPHEAINAAIAALEQREQPALADVPQVVATLNAICDALHIGRAVRGAETILTNIHNLIRRGRCLDAVEREFLTVEVPPDEDEPDSPPMRECLVSWGAEPDEYIAQVRLNLRATRAGTAHAPIQITATCPGIKASHQEARHDEAPRGALFRHKGTGVLYRFLRYGNIINDSMTLTAEKPTPCVVYQSEDEDSDGVWVRPRIEFHDGRFKRVEEPERPAAGAAPATSDSLHYGTLTGAPEPARPGRTISGLLTILDDWRSTLNAVRENRHCFTNEDYARLEMDLDVAHHTIRCITPLLSSKRETADRKWPRLWIEYVVLALININNVTNWGRFEQAEHILSALGRAGALNYVGAK